MILTVAFKNGTLSIAVKSILIGRMQFDLSAIFHLDFHFAVYHFRSGSSDLRSQTPSPHFGQLTMNVPKNERDIYRTNATHSDGVNQSITNRNMMNMELTSARVPSPHQVWPNQLFNLNDRFCVAH